jgi:hypothetical protein
VDLAKVLDSITHEYISKAVERRSAVSAKLDGGRCVGRAWAFPPGVRAEVSLPGEVTSPTVERLFGLTVSLRNALGLDSYTAFAVASCADDGGEPPPAYVQVEGEAAPASPDAFPQLFADYLRENSGLLKAFYAERHRGLLQGFAVRVVDGKRVSLLYRRRRDVRPLLIGAAAAAVLALFNVLLAAAAAVIAVAVFLARR